MAEAERVDAYLDTVSRLEPDIAPIDTPAALASIAISLRRIADAMQPPTMITHGGPLTLAQAEKAKAWWRNEFGAPNPSPPPPDWDSVKSAGPESSSDRGFVAWLRRMMP